MDNGIDIDLNTHIHLPVALGNCTADIVDLANKFYLFGINTKDYESREAYLNSEGRICFDLIPLNSNLRPIRFINFVTKVVRTTTLVQPVVPLISVTVERELQLFKGITPNVPFDVLKVSEIPRKVAELLNKYTSGIGWVSSSYGNYSTAGLALLFSGVCGDAPKEYRVVKETMQLVVLQINSGVNRGVVYLTYDPSKLISLEPNYIGKV